MDYLSIFGRKELSIYREGIGFGEGARALKDKVKPGVVHTFISRS